MENGQNGWKIMRRSMAKPGETCWFRFSAHHQAHCSHFWSNLNGIHYFICSLICWDTAGIGLKYLTFSYTNKQDF